MPYPDIYTNIIFIAITLIFAFICVSSVAFYNTLYKKGLLSDTHLSSAVKNKLFYFVVFLIGLVLGIFAAMSEITFSEIILIFMLPAAVAAAICEIKNGFVPVFCVILIYFCLTARLLVSLFNGEDIILQFVSGGILAAFLMIAVNFLSKKTGGGGSDLAQILTISIIFASSGFTVGLILLTAAELLAFLTFLPKTLKNKERILLLSPPVTPFLFAAFYLAAFSGVV